jgi:hypothetical protein
MIAAKEPAMNDEPADSREQAEPPSVPQNPPENATPADLRAECERLRQLVRGLEEERQRDQECLAAVQKERDEYSNAVDHLTQRQFAITREDIAEAERDGLTLDQFIGKLEAIVNGKP